MSLDVYLISPQKIKSICSHCNTEVESEEELFEANITHNLFKMAHQAGIYKLLWRPDELEIFVASLLISPLENAIAWMKSDPKFFKQFDSPNGWGTYDQFLPWLERYLEACIKYPDAIVEVSR